MWSIKLLSSKPPNQLAQFQFKLLHRLATIEHLLRIGLTNNMVIVESLFHIILTFERGHSKTCSKVNQETIKEEPETLEPVRTIHRPYTTLRLDFSWLDTLYGHVK